MGKKVILDTNALLLFGQGTDLFSEVHELLHEPFTFLIPQAVMAELEELALKNGKDARAAKLAQMLIQQKQKAGRTATQALKIAPSSGGYADDAIIAIAEDGDDRPG